MQLKAHGELPSSARRGRVLLELRSQGQVSHFLLAASPALGQAVRIAVHQDYRINYLLMLFCMLLNRLSMNYCDVNALFVALLPYPARLISSTCFDQYFRLL